MATKKTTQKLTRKQIKWLDKCTEGKWTWKLNPQTVLVDVEGNFDCRGQRLTSLQGVRFGVVTGHCYCSDNSITSLEGAPRRVGGGFYCSNNSLTSLEGAPREVGWDFFCSDNPVSEEALKECYRLMQWKTYTQAVQMLWGRLDQDEKAPMYRPSFDWLSTEEHQQLSVLQKYQQIKELI